MLEKEITSSQHPLVKHLVKLREDRAYRSNSKTALISGIKLIGELATHKIFTTLLIARGYTPPFSFKAEKTLFVTDEIMKKVTALQAPEPLAAEIALPQPTELSGKHPLLVLDHISDPGNLGTLLRTALALGWEEVFLTSGSADPFNDKALRAAKGATFKLKLQQGSHEELLRLVEKNKLHLLIADAKGKSIATCVPVQPLALVLGNEARGVHPNLKANGELIAIPIAEAVESLNVATAGAILMHHFRGDSHAKR